MGRIGRRLTLAGLASLLMVTGTLPGGLGVALADTTAGLVQTIDPSTWVPNAPGPAGVAYRPATNSLIVVDSDRNNVDGFNGVDLWEYDLDTATIVYTGVLPTDEPTGVAFDPVTSNLFVSSDSTQSVFVIQPGADERFGTGDDPTAVEIPLGGDIEDPAFAANGRLYVLDGTAALIWEIDPVNGTFGDIDDLPPNPFGIPMDLGGDRPNDWEGLASDPATGNLIAGAKDDQVIFEFTTAGTYVQTHDASAVPGMQSISGLGAQPTGGGFPTTYWIADRGDSGDVLSNDGKLFRITFGAAPQVAPVAQDQTVNTGVNLAKSITLVANDINGDSLTYTVTQPSHGTVTTGTLATRTYTPTAGFSGIDSFTFTAFDGTATSNTATVTVNVGNSPPSVFELDGLLHAEGEPVSVTLFADDPDPDGTPAGTLTWTANGLPAGLTISPSTGLITGTVAIGATSGSPYTVTVTATDNGNPPLNDQVTFNWSINNTNRSPVLANISNKTVAQGNQLSFTATATDPDGDGLTFSLVGSPAGATISGGGSFTWTPSQSPGNYDVTVKVTDSGSPVLTDSQTFTVTVQASDPGDIDPFIDDNGHLFEDAIEWLDSQGITSGCNPPLNNRFCPNDFVTRGQMAAFLVRAFDYTAIGNDYFSDDNGSIFENSINRLRTAEVTLGCNPPANTRFCPDGFVTRGQMAAFLVRASGYTDNGGGDLFIDDDTSVFESAIDKLRTAGVTMGCNPPVNNRYCPDDRVTRGQMAAFLKRAFDA